MWPRTRQKVLLGMFLRHFFKHLEIDRIIWFLKHNWNDWVEAAHRVSGDLGNGINDDTLTWLHWDLSQEEIDLAKQFNLYASLLNGGAQIVIVAHSQGNYFTNIVYGMLIDKFGRDLIKQRVKVVAVANPDFYVAGGGPETTLKEDTVISSFYRYKVQHILSEPWTTILSPGNVTIRDSDTALGLLSDRKYQVGDIDLDERAIIVVVLFFWVLIWKGWALWIAATKRHKVWFVLLLFFNTLGLLDMLYIFIVSKSGRVKYLPGVTSAEHVIEETEKRENS